MLRILRMNNTQGLNSATHDNNAMASANERHTRLAVLYRRTPHVTSSATQARALKARRPKALSERPVTTTPPSADGRHTRRVPLYRMTPQVTCSATQAHALKPRRLKDQPILYVNQRCYLSWGCPIKPLYTCEVTTNHFAWKKRKQYHLYSGVGARTGKGKHDGAEGWSKNEIISWYLRDWAGPLPKSVNLLGSGRLTCQLAPHLSV